MTALCTARFGPLAISYDDRVLAPREWTAMQSEWVAELSPRVSEGPILELCAGAGHIGLLAAHLTGRALVQVEADDVAAEFARRNAAAANIAVYEMRAVGLTTAVDDSERFPIVIADPPYIPTADMSQYPDDPPLAIDGGADGLAVVRTCAAVADRVLSDDGALLMQVRGKHQADEVDGLVRGATWRLAVKDVRSCDEDRAIVLLARD